MGKLFCHFLFYFFFLRMRDLSGRNIRKFLKLISKKAFLGPKKSQNNKVAEKRRVNHNRESKKRNFVGPKRNVKRQEKDLS